MSMPAIRPEKYKKGKYGRMAEKLTRSAATANCPILWIIPPTQLTPMMEMCGCFIFVKTNMIKRLVMLPAKLYKKPNRLPKVNAFNIFRIKETENAPVIPWRYKARTITRLASPSLIPGKGIGRGNRFSR